MLKIYITLHVKVQAYKVKVMNSIIHNLLQPKEVWDWSLLSFLYNMKKNKVV